MCPADSLDRIVVYCPCRRVYSRHQGLCLKWASTGNRKQFCWNLWASNYCSFSTCITLITITLKASRHWNINDSSCTHGRVCFLCDKYIVYLHIPVASWVGWRLSGGQRSSPFALPLFRMQTEISCQVFQWWCHTSNGSLGWRAVARVRLYSCSPCCRWTLLHVHMHP